MTTRPSHHGERGFVNPWPTFFMPSRADLVRWQQERRTKPLPPNPPAESFPIATPVPVANDPDPRDLVATWVGHSTWILQIGGVNILTDPQWSERASPVSWAGPRRLTAPGITFESLPRIDLVLISHDHYDHLDAPTVRRLARRFGEGLTWATPLGYARWFRRFGVRPVELDWWESRRIDLPGGRNIEIDCLPAQHWTSRLPWDRMRRLWSSWAIRGGGRAIYFGGDSGWFPEYGRIGEQAGPFDLTLLPIGAYEPRWFMKASHMNPEDAVQAFLEMDASGGAGTMAGMHWGSFRLTDEDPLEPAERLRRVWGEAGLPESRLWLARLGESRQIAPSGDSDESA